MKFGAFIRQKRETKATKGKTLSLRALAEQLGMDPGYLSKIERDKVQPPPEGLILKIATALDEDPDALLALAGKIPSDVHNIVVRSKGKLPKAIRKIETPSPRPVETHKFTGKPQRRPQELRGAPNEDSSSAQRWKIKDTFDEGGSLPRDVLLELQSKYKLSDRAAQNLWFDVEFAMQPNIHPEQKGESERSKEKARKTLDVIQHRLSAATTCLQDSSSLLSQIYFIDPVTRAAEDNPYHGFVQRLELLQGDLATFELDLIDLLRGGVDALVNDFKSNGLPADGRRQRISAAVFEALVVSGHELTWTYDDLREHRNSTAISMINEVSMHLMAPFEAFPASTLYADWQNWKAKQRAGNSSGRKPD